MPRVTVLDVEMGNLRSVAKAVERAGAEVVVSDEIDDAADGLIVPGQGAFGACVRTLGARLEEIRRWIDAGRPYFGICLGLQVLFEGSEEEPGAAGAGVLAGTVVRLPDDNKLPHIGWNEVEPRATDDGLFAGIGPRTRYYFVHSFAAVPTDDAVTAATTTYGITFASAVATQNVWATQFHPEKSADAGQALLRNVVTRLAA